MSFTISRSSGNSSGCIPSSVLELWGYNFDVISKLTEDDIKLKINEEKLTSPMTGRPINIARLVGGITTVDMQNRTTKQVIKAKYLTMVVRLKKRTVFDESEGLEVNIF